MAIIKAIIKAQGKSIECPIGANLRQVLLAHDVDLYNGRANVINCHSLGTCGTCAVTITGAVSPLNWKEKARLGLHPHSLVGSREKGRRLACQVQVMGDITVTKFDRFWGQGDTIVWTADEAVKYVSISDGDDLPSAMADKNR
jgi:ferredoxin